MFWHLSLSLQSIYENLLSFLPGSAGGLLNSGGVGGHAMLTAVAAHGLATLVMMPAAVEFVGRCVYEAVFEKLHILLGGKYAFHLIEVVLAALAAHTALVAALAFVAGAERLELFLLLGGEVESFEGVGTCAGAGAVGDSTFLFSLHARLSRAGSGGILSYGDAGEKTGEHYRQRDDGFFHVSYIYAYYLLISFAFIVKTTDFCKSLKHN